MSRTRTTLCCKINLTDGNGTKVVVVAAAAVFLMKSGTSCLFAGTVLSHRMLFNRQEA